MEAIDTDCLKQLDNLLAAGDQSWLFGSGISFAANIPLMGPLTARVFAMADEDEDKGAKEVLDAVKAMLPENSHIEHILSHLVDFAAIAERSKDKSILVGETRLELDQLQDLHAKVLKWISETIRWGFVPKILDDAEKIGSRENTIVTVAGHIEFLKALFNRNQQGIEERRRAVRFFTVNYDTLLEDALALGCFSHWDGFTGGAVAYRSHRYGQNEPDSGYRAHVIKIHGSIDWHLGPDERVWRVRDVDGYPERKGRVLIYPQFTKYLATQRDPFAAQFDLFRRALGSGRENVLAVCGYSFGDEHINQEIELALQRPENKTTILAFSRSLCEVLDNW
ncbi:MAG: SIR2 family protein [Nitrospirales bacterium]|nr:SIR2 family protein [Nitrospirales bacterium]